MTQATGPVEFTWGLNEESFRFSTLAELLGSHSHMGPGTTVFFGEVTRPNHSQFVDADDVINTMADRAGDLAGDYADGYPNVSKEAEAELNALLTAWAEKHATIDFYTVGNIQQHVVTEADLTTLVPQ